MRNRYKNLSDEEFNAAVREFTKRGYKLLDSLQSKARKFIGDGLPTVFLGRRDDGTYTNTLMIHPCTPRDRFRFTLLDNERTEDMEDSKLFIYNNLNPFPVIEGKRRNHLKVNFRSIDELGEILDNLIEIGPIEDTQPTTQQKETSNQKSEDIPDLNAETMSDLYTQTPLKTEGGKNLAFTYRYERNSELREQALKEYGYDCAVCGMNFYDQYGELGKNFIEVHHKIPVSEGEREASYEQLVPLCPNCHRMIHRLYRELEPSQYEDAVDLLRKRLK